LEVVETWHDAEALLILAELSGFETICGVSEQEAEVAEALFDLARMFTQPPPSASAVESKAEAKAAVNEVKPEGKQDMKIGGSSLPPQAPTGPAAVPSASSAGGASLAAIGGSVSVRSKSPCATSAASPAPSPPAAAAASVVDGMPDFCTGSVRIVWNFWACTLICRGA